MDGTRWLTEKFNVEDLPLSKQVKYACEKIQEAIGYTHELHKSELGNLYAELDLRTILADVCC